MPEEHSYRDGHDLAPRAGAIGPPRFPEDAALLPDQKLRIAFISNPNSIHTHRWVSWFARRGHTVCLLADVPPTEAWSDVQVVDLSKVFYARVIRFPIWAIWLRRFLWQWQPDVLHAHRVNSAGWLGAASGFHPLVVTPWGSDVMLGPQSSRMLHLLARFTLRNADKITIISQAIEEQVIQLGARKETLVSIKHGVDLEVFSPRKIPPEEHGLFCQEQGIPEVARLVFSPRALRPIYNQDVILRAIPTVCQRFPAVCFIFTDYNVSTDYKHALDRLVVELGVEDSIRWLPATTNPAEMAKRYLFSDLVISVPSSDGGTPLTVLEAMACGKSVVCSDLPALQEFVSNGNTGWLVPVGDAPALAKAIIHVLEQPEQAGEVGRRAHQLIVDRANLDVEMQRMEGVYFQLAGSVVK